MSKLGKYWPILVTLLGVFAPMLNNSAQNFWTHHPDIVAALFGAWGAIKFLMPSPVQPK